MTQLRRHRRDRRARAPKRRRRRNLGEFVPRGDSDFALTARNFAVNIADEPETFGLTAEDAAAISETVSAFRAALYQAQLPTCSSQTIRAKNEARASAEEVVRRYGNMIRANPDVPKAKKHLLRIRERPARLRRSKCPSDPPMLQFVRSADGVTSQFGHVARGVHVLKYFECVQSDMRQAGIVRKGKPDGAVRLELFCGFVRPNDPVPTYPGANGCWWMYLRSFTRSPMEVQFPLPSEPMRIVYWAKWADATGETSRFSKTCVAGVACAGPGRTAGVELPDSGAHRELETKCVIVQMPEYALPAADDAGQLDAQVLLPAMECVEARRDEQR